MVKDIFLTDNDLSIGGGDLLIQESDMQHIEHIINANKGNYYHSPLTGVGAIKYVGGYSSNQALEQEIRLQLKRDNYTILELSTTKNIDESKIYVNAIRNEDS